MENENLEVLRPHGTRVDPNWRIIVDAMADPAVVLDGVGTVLHHNPLIADIFPRVRDGQPISLLSRGPELLEGIERARRKQQRIVVQLHDRVPVSRRLSAIITTLSIDEPRALEPAILIAFRDLTDQERHAQLRADFIANASHELRTPLASMKVIVETLQGAARDDSTGRERFLAMLATQANRMTRLIDDLLSLNRVEMRAHLPPRGSVDMVELLSNVTASMEPLAETSGMKIVLKTADDLGSVRGEPEELAQVFQNLVQNAIKYGGDSGGTITISLSRQSGNSGESVVVTVADEGIGIAPEHLPRLTERFYRINVAASREKGGTGLGLAIVKHIISRHRGDLRIESELGKGSQFSVILPVGTRAARGAAARKSQSQI